MLSLDGGKKIFLTLTILLGAGFFIFPKILTAASVGDIVINEIMYGRTDGAKFEFIELYNNTDQAIDLGGFSLKKKTQSGSESNLVSKNKFIGTIPAHGFFIITHPDYASQITSDLVYSGSSYSIANNNTVLLYDAEDNLLDKVGWGEASDFESLVAIGPENNQSIERKNVGQDTGNNYADFQVLNLPTPGSQNTGQVDPVVPSVCGNGLIETGEACDDSNTTDNDGCSAICALENANPDDTEIPEENENKTESGSSSSAQKLYRLGNVLISEFVSDPADNDTEWIELFNNTNKNINLQDWTLEDGSETITKLTGNLEKFLVIESPKGKLNNSGDIIILRDPQGNLIDQVAYGDWNNSNKSNAPLANDPNSVARKIDNYNTFNNANDFALTTTPTKNAGNLIAGLAQDSDLSPEEIAQFDYSAGITITEIFPDPRESDEQNEFIELFNFEKNEINLSGWKLEDLSGKKFIIKDKSIKSGEYLAFFRPETKIALNNNSETIKLFQPLEDKPVQTIEYKNALENQSYNLIEEAKLPIGSLASGAIWSWSETVTPNKTNQVKAVNQLPIVEFYCPEEALVNIPIIFDSSDTSDDSEAELKFSWDFGDGLTNTLANPEHTYFNLGTYTIKLTVNDSENQTTKEKIIRIVKELNPATTTVSGWSEEYSAPVILNEIMPSPVGADETNEWIEIYNQGDTRINLFNWKLDDSEGGSSPYSFKEDLWLDPSEYLLLDRPITKISLNNDFDIVRLFNQKELADQTEYQDAPEGETWTRGQNGKWFWTISPTPKEKNIVSLASGAETSSYGRSLSASEKNSSGIIFEIPLEKISEQTIGDKIKTRGTVAVLPGIFASQYFYITGSAGVQVYSYKKDFPELKIGDLIEVTGELSQTNGEWRVKTKTTADIKILDSNISLPPTPKTCAELADCQAGELLALTGEVVEQKGSSLFLDDGTDEALVYVKTATGINPKNYKPGETISVSGILTRTASGARLMPRSPDDIIQKNSENTAEGQVLGEVSAENEWTLPARDKKLELFKYLLAIAGAVITLLIGLLIKMKK